MCLRMLNTFLDVGNTSQLPWDAGIVSIGIMVGQSATLSMGSMMNSGQHAHQHYFTIVSNLVCKPLFW